LILKFPYKLQDVYEASKQNRFNVISTFSGGGGSSIGYSLAGGKVLAANEFVDMASETYKANFPNTEMIVGDIRELSGLDLMCKANVLVGELDILDGSPPCSAFSMIGNREAGWGQEKNYSDGKKVKNIENLFYDFIRLADEIKPKIIIAENVEGLQQGPAKKMLNSFLNEFDKIGYIASYSTINAKDFGVASSRPRTIIVGVRKDIFEASGNIFPSNFFPNEVPKKLNVADAFEGLVQTDEEIEEARNLIGEDSKINQVMQSFPKVNDTDRWMTIEYADPELTNDGNSFFSMKKLALYRYSPCLTASVTASGNIHPLENRKLTVKESQRLMGLPDDYINKGKPIQQFERIGRMHAPFCVAHIANNIVKEYLGK